MSKAIEALSSKLDTLITLMTANAQALPQARITDTPKAAKVSKPKAGKGRKVTAAGVVQAEDESAVLKAHIAKTLDAARAGKAAATCPWDGNVALKATDAHPTREGVVRQRFHGCKHTLNVNVAARS